MRSQLTRTKYGLAALGVVLLVAIGVLARGTLAETIDPANDGSQYAYGENIGWINAENTGCANCGLNVGTFYLTGYMWSENVGWINMHCENNTLCEIPGGGNWGVNKSSAGKLSGYAWSENAGWINFSCSTNYGPSCTGSPAGTWGVSIDPSGVFNGYAWAENAGWISFSDMSPVAYQVRSIADADFDAFPDGTDNCPNWFNFQQQLPAWTIPPGDADCDGFRDTVGATNSAPETYIGTVPTQHCAASSAPDNEPTPDAWPVDFNDNRIVNGQDVGKFATAYNKSVAMGPFGVPPLPGKRFDFSGNGIINGQDIGKFAAFYNKGC
jgi:hypothetical protein